MLYRPDVINVHLSLSLCVQNEIHNLIQVEMLIHNYVFHVDMTLVIHNDVSQQIVHLKSSSFVFP